MSNTNGLPIERFRYVAMQDERVRPTHARHEPTANVRFVVSRLEEGRPGLDVPQIVYLEHLDKEMSEPVVWCTDLEAPEVWKFSDRFEAELMLSYAAGYDETAAVVEFES